MKRVTVRATNTSLGIRSHALQSYRMTKCDLLIRLNYQIIWDLRFVASVTAAHRQEINAAGWRWVVDTAQGTIILASFGMRRSTVEWKKTRNT